MKTNFEPFKGPIKKVVTKNKKIGPGETGAKSAALAKFGPMIERLFPKRENYADLVVTLPQAAITPEFFKSFLNRAGASHDNPRSKKEIKNTPFNPEETNAIRELTEPFNGLPIALRSDEATAAGVGLWHTDFMAASTSKRNTDKACKIIKKILFSEYSEDVAAFKKRVGIPLEQTSGVFATPVFGRYVAGEAALAPIYHMNMITSFKANKALLNVGVGLAGANSKHCISQLSSELKGDYLSAVAKGFFRDAKLFYNERITRVIQNSKEAAQDSLLSYACEVGLADIMIDDMQRVTQTIAGNLYNKFGSLYLELGYNGQFGILQVAQVNLKDVQIPDIPEEKKILTIESESSDLVPHFGMNVCKRGRVETDKIFYIDEAFKLYDKKNLKKLDEFNRENQNYVLIVNNDFATFSQFSSFKDYSNAAAIIMVKENPFTSITTHLGGAVREAGIIVLVGKMNKEFLETLVPGKLINRKLLIYANDAEEEAFIADME